MTSIYVATRSRGRRCAHCNQRAEAWLCQTCAFSSASYVTRFSDDARSTSATTVGRRNLYPGIADGYRGMPELPALTEFERLGALRPHIESHVDLTPQQQHSLLLDLKNNAKAYAALARRVDARRHERDTGAGYVAAHWNRVSPLDPRRWCDDCTSARRHRHDCPLIGFDGPFVGGYPNDGIRIYQPQTFKQLATPSKHWQPVHHKQHRRAIARRWQAFLHMWTRIGLDCFTRMLEAGSKKSLPHALQPPPTARRTRAARRTPVDWFNG